MLATGGAGAMKKRVTGDTATARTGGTVPTERTGATDIAVTTGGLSYRLRSSTDFRSSSRLATITPFLRLAIAGTTGAVGGAATEKEEVETAKAAPQSGSADNPSQYCQAQGTGGG
jgi:hypothetical protein